MPRWAPYGAPGSIAGPRFPLMVRRTRRVGSTASASCGGPISGRSTSPGPVSLRHGHRSSGAQGSIQARAVSWPPSRTGSCGRTRTVPTTMRGDHVSELEALAKRLQELEDREEIRQVIWQYSFLLDTGNWDRIAD